MQINHFSRKVILCCLVLSLAACGSFSSVKKDSAPRHGKIDFNAIPDAEPKPEPYSRYGNPESYVVFGKTYYPLKSSENFTERGIASWYGTKFHGNRTSSGETYDMYAMTAAHKTLPLPTYVRVKNLDNGKQITVKVNDRGPFHQDRIIDLSYVAANKLGIAHSGTGRVEIEAINFSQNGGIDDEGVFVQVGAYSDQANAKTVQLKLAQAEIDSVISPVTINARKRVYRVRVGPFAQKESADRMVNDLHNMGLGDARLFFNNEF